MPKLSALVEQKVCQQWPASAAGAADHPAASGGPLGRRAPALPQPAAAKQQQQQQPQQQQQAGTPGLDAQHSAAAAKLQAEFAKRLREQGPRCFRWPDGSLRPDRPPPNPHTVASRQQWAPLVQHCRMTGGDREYERQGQSLRYGLGVDHQQHEAYLALIGLTPEADAAGKHAGEAPGLADPLQDPEHCFNTYYKEGAEAVFKDKRGRLL